MRDELENISRWAQSKIDAGTEPPWAWYQYMKLREATGAILAGMDAVNSTESCTTIGATSGNASPISGGHVFAR